MLFPATASLTSLSSAYPPTYCLLLRKPESFRSLPTTGYMILIYNQCFRSTSEHPNLLFISHFLVFSSIFAEIQVFSGWNDMFDRVRGAKIRFLFHLTLSYRFSGAARQCRKWDRKKRYATSSPTFSHGSALRASRADAGCRVSRGGRRRPD